MADNHYLLELEESSGQDKFVTRHLITAESEQHVKYHYHRTLKDRGYTDTRVRDTHLLEWDRAGWPTLMSSIVRIKPLSESEYAFLKNLPLPRWDIV
jgi:hypothetical protein